MTTRITCTRLTIATLLLCLSCFLGRGAAAAQFTHPTLGYSLTYPDSWRVFVASGPEPPVDLMSFQEALHGGLIPAGGASINIQVLPSDQTNETALARFKWEGTGRRSTQQLRGVRADRLDLENDLGASHLYKRVVLAQRINGRQFLFILDCHADDPQISRWEQVLAEVVESVSVAKGDN
jgi:hypothetical protein